MIEYIQFWLAKGIADCGIALIVIGIVIVALLVTAWLSGDFRRKNKE